MLRLPRAVVLHSKNLKSYANHMRAIAVSVSNANCSTKTSDTLSPPTSSSGTQEGVTQSKANLVNSPALHDREISLLGPKDGRAPLPGDIGVVSVIQRKADKKESSPTPKVRIKHLTHLTNVEETVEKMQDESNYTRQYKAVEQFIHPEYESVEDNSVSMLGSEMLECVAHECPQLLIKDFTDLFPFAATKFKSDLNSKLTVITICQKTNNDMTAWTSEVDVEREELMGMFVMAATNICKYLKTEGFWADFIDPSSGRPFLGEYTNATMFETDERYRHFGFTIEDLGCCKVISHHRWGTRSYVGCLFTTASIDCDEVSKVLGTYQLPNEVVSK